RSACSSTRRTATRRGARSASRRTSSRRRGRRSSTRSSTPSSRAGHAPSPPRSRPDTVSVRQDEIPLARPVLGDEEADAVREVLRSGQLSLGPRVPAFEQAFAARIGATHACAVSSGTAGLHLALRAAGVTDGDEVVTSPFSFVASANAPIYERARPVFADIDPRTLTL